MNFVPRTTVCSPAVLRKVILSTARLLQHDSLRAGLQRGTAEAELPRTTTPNPPPWLVLRDFWPPSLAHPAGTTARGCGETSSEDLPTCGTASPGVEIKPNPKPLAIQIVINNFSP